MADNKPRSFNCLNCQKSMQFDPSLRNVDDDKKRIGDMEEGLGGQSVSLIKIICDAEIPHQAPICRECSDELMKDMDQQLANREEECLSYKKLLDDLRANFSLTNNDTQREMLRMLKEEERQLENELKALTQTEDNLEKEYQQLKQKQNQESEEEKRYWREFRDKHRRLLDVAESTARVDAELRYAERQHNRLASTNVLDLAFHIWIDSEGGTIPEINGHRLGRLPDKPVDWLEINAAFGQVVLLMDVLLQRANVKQDTYKLVAQGSHSSVKVKKSNGDMTTFPLHCFGSWKPFGNNNMDNGIIALLGCFELLYHTLQAQDPNFRLPYKINKDRLMHQNFEYFAKMLLNSEERWTKAMKMFLANLKTAQIQVVAMRELRPMRSSDRRLKRSRSSDSESEDEGGRPRQRISRRRRSAESETKLPSTSLLTLSLLAILGARNLLPSPSDLAEMDAYSGNMDFPMGYKARPQRLRYRDDMSMVRHSMMKSSQEWNPYMMETEPMMMMPVAVADRGRVNPLARSVLSPTTSAHSSHQQDPSLEDIDLIDVLWRSDIAAEKGQSQYTPSDQYEHDLQLLTEKSIREPLTTSETARYEDLAKGYFEDFFFPVGCKSSHLESQDDMRREMSTPTDEDLDALLEDVTKEGGQLDQLCPNGLEPSGPLLNNVSLGQGIIYDANNATYEMTAPCTGSLADSELFTNGSLESPSWQNNLGPSDIFPAGPQDSVFPMFPQNETSVPIISTGVHFNHSYTSPNSDVYSSSYYVPNSYNNESSVCSSSTTSRSPTYMSDAENMPPVSRYYGKLAPSQAEYHQEDAKEHKEDEAELGSPLPRRRGRQSKDEQLAKMNNLPLSAKEIAEMSLADLQKMLKSENLTDSQKALVKKIRRRGKNKVAARTCRQRRGDKIAKSSQEWMDPSQLSLDA